MKGGNTYEKKLLTRLFIAMLILTFTPTMNTQAKAKNQIEQNKDFFTKRENLHLESKRNKEKSKVVKQQKNDRNCNKRKEKLQPKSKGNSSDHSQDRKERNTNVK